MLAGDSWASWNSHWGSLCDCRIQWCQSLLRCPSPAGEVAELGVGIPGIQKRLLPRRVLEVFGAPSSRVWGWCLEVGVRAAKKV